MCTRSKNRIGPSLIDYKEAWPFAYLVFKFGYSLHPVMLLGEGLGEWTLCVTIVFSILPLSTCSSLKEVATRMNEEVKIEGETMDIAAEFF